MKTTEQWMAEALAEMKKATWPPEKWCAAIQDGYPPGHEYDWMATHNYKAQQAMWNAAHPPPSPAPVPPPPPSGVPSGNRCLYFSTVNDETVAWVASLGIGYTALFSADVNLSSPGGPYHVTDAQVTLLRAHSVTVASWSDCSATPYSKAVEIAQRPGFSFAGGQAEDSDQYRQAIAGGAKHIIGNPANLSSAVTLNDAIERTRNGELAFIGEVLHPDPAYSAQGVNISSACMYVDMDQAQGGYQPLYSFGGMPAGLKAGASIYTPGRLSESDRTLYEQWTRP